MHKIREPKEQPHNKNFFFFINDLTLANVTLRLMVVKMGASVSSETHVTC
jgi:hypothetical protein